MGRRRDGYRSASTPREGCVHGEMPGAGRSSDAASSDCPCRRPCSWLPDKPDMKRRCRAENRDRCPAARLPHQKSNAQPAMVEADPKRTEIVRSRSCPCASSAPRYDSAAETPAIQPKSGSSKATDRATSLQRLRISTASQFTSRVITDSVTTTCWLKTFPLLGGSKCRI